MSQASAVPIGGEKPQHRVPIRERLRVWWQNWKVRHIGNAIRVLSKALREDPEFRQTWHANIAMPIYDATRPQCHCGAPECGHHSTCQIRQAETIPRRFECREMSIEQAHYIADRLMKHLFEA